MFEIVEIHKEIEPAIVPKSSAIPSSIAQG
jgi:hypothetical protein